MARKLKIGFLGYGNMAEAIVGALDAKSGRLAAKAAGYTLLLAVYDTDGKKLERVPFKVAAADSKESILYNCDIIFAAVKPQSAAEALGGLDFTGKTLISIMAGVSLNRLAALAGHKTEKLVRVMPNMNARVGSAYSAFCCRGIDAAEIRLIEILLSSFGSVRCVEESVMDTATGICGSGPAFVFAFIDALIQSGIKNGLSAAIAREMALQTVIGSAYLFESEERPAGELIDSVCSKGGTTIEGIRYLEEHGFAALVTGAVERSKRRAKEMEEQNENG